MTFGLVSATLSKLGLGGSSSVPPSTPHPLDPLSPAEIASAVEAIRAHAAQYSEEASPRVWFKTIGLLEPPKAVLAPYLDAWHEARGRGASIEATAAPRKAEAIVGVKNETSRTWYGEYIRFRRCGVAEDCRGGLDVCGDDHSGFI